LVHNLTKKFFKLDVSFFSGLCISSCSFATLSQGKLLKKIKYTKVYYNADKDKLNILKDNKGKSGIYLWGNKENGKFYIGSSSDLRRRLMLYYNINFLAKFSTSYINNALLKEGYSAFRFYIIEYCNKEDLIKREQYYFDLLKPTYNICKTAGSSLGRLHTEESKIKMAKAKLSKILPEEVKKK
jgi:predicted GIY-YIG superfamily endonuclease